MNGKTEVKNDSSLCCIDLKLIAMSLTKIGNRNKELISRQ